MKTSSKKTPDNEHPSQPRSGQSAVRRDTRFNLDMLRERYAPAPVPEPSPKTSPPHPASPSSHLNLLRSPKVFKAAVAAVGIVLLGWTPAQRLLATTSVEAIVNGRVTTVRAPIEGLLSASKDNLKIGSLLANNEPILTISNPRAERSHLNNLQRARGDLRTLTGTLEAKQAVLARMRDDLAQQKERFRAGRIEQLQQRINETEADIASAQARHEEAAQGLERARALRKNGVATQATLDKAVKDESVAMQGINGLIERRKGMLVELDATRDGTFLGDSYNDTPQSAQRALDVELEFTDAQSRLAGARKQLADIGDEISDEIRRLQARSEVVLRSSVRGRIWEVMVSPGEHVNAGQDLLRILECGSLLVTASVGERSYQSLHVGQGATFRLRSNDAVMAGQIIGLNGLASVSSGTAIQQSALTREPYHVTLEFPQLADGLGCDVGRTGLVIFETGSALDGALRRIGLR